LTLMPRPTAGQPQPVAKRFVVQKSLSLLGREFVGAYEQTPRALDSVRMEAAQHAVPIDTLSAASRFLSDPDRTPAAQRRVFHGFVTSATSPSGRLLLRALTAGEYVVASTQDPAVLAQLHSAVVALVERDRLVVADDPPTLLTTVSDGRPLFTLYLGPIRASTRDEPNRSVQPLTSSAMQRVSSLAGAWMVRFRGRPTPKDSFSTSYTSSIITPLLGGGFQQERVAMPLPKGGAISLIGLLGYDQFRQQYRFAWLDDAYAMFDVHEGAWQQDRLVVNNVRSRTTLKDGRRDVYGQMVWRDVTMNSFIVESQASVDSGATWFTQAEARYERTGPACDAPVSVSDTLTIRALETEGARSNVAGMTAERAREFFAPDWRSRQPDGSTLDLPAILAAYRNGRSVPWASRFDITKLSLHVYCNVAHVIGRADAHALGMPATAPPIRFEWINVWRRDDQRWRYLYNEFTMVAPPRP
jgi:Protein of unknown function (DUF1579)/Domain of unknown function (DUF4440)